MVFTGVCLFVCPSVFSDDIAKNGRARVTKLDVQMFHDESWKLFILWLKDQRSRSQIMHKNIAGVIIALF